MSSAHPLALRVLRLQRPVSGQLQERQRLPFAEEGQQGEQQDALLLPTSFGVIHLGQTFSALLVAVNESPHRLDSAGLRIEMQSPSQKVVLADARSTAPVEPGETIQVKVEYEVKDPGQHALQCSVGYHWQEDKPSSFKKLYKFSSVQPLSVRTKTHASKASISHFSELRSVSYLEVQVQNTSYAPITFSRVTFDPASKMTFRDVNTAPDHLKLLAPGDVRQFLYVCQPDPDSHHNIFQADALLESARQQGDLDLGKLELGWCTSGGETGHLQTALLQRKVSSMPVSLAAGGTSMSDNVQVSLSVDNITHLSPLRVNELFTVAFKMKITARNPTMKGTFVVQPVLYHRTPEAASASQTYPSPTPSPSHQNSSAQQPSSSLVYLGQPLVTLGTTESPTEDSLFHFELIYTSSEDGLINVGGLRLLFEEMVTDQSHAHHQVLHLAEWASVAQVEVARS